MTRNKIRLVFLTTLFFLFVFTPYALAAYEIGFTGLPAAVKSIIGHTEDDLVEVYDENGKYIFASCMGVSEGDRYIDEDNTEYRVTKVNGKRATARSLGKVDLLGGDGTVSSLTPLVQAQDNRKIAIYHTHSAESYKPGPPFRTNRGEIYEVGDMLARQCEQKGIQVIKSENTFLPHDGGAYERSRRTAAELVRQQPDAVFDIHRDAIPRAQEYLTNVKGEEMSKVRLVVGRENPKMATNEQMARRLKAIADKKYPGLVKGIYYANGKYNQDLSARALLLEFGTHVTTKEQAERSTAALADSIYTLLYGAGSTTGGGGAGTNRSLGGAGWRSLIWVIGAVVVVGLGFLFLNEGGAGGVSKRLKNFTGEEFANVLGRRTRRKRDKK